jgi:hypothetical protein
MYGANCWLYCHTFAAFMGAKKNLARSSRIVAFISTEYASNA